LVCDANVASCVTLILARKVTHEVSYMNKDLLVKDSCYTYESYVVFHIELSHMNESWHINES